MAGCFGIADSCIWIYCDWDGRFADACDACIAEAEAFAACETRVFIAKPRRGIDLAKLFIIPQALEVAEFVTVLEDDCHPAPDALRYFDHCAEAYRDDSRVWSVTGYNRTQAAARNLPPYRLEFRPRAFVPWGYGLWRDRWEALFGGGAARYLSETGPKANGLFDWYVCRNLPSGAGLIRPSLSRILLDGWEDAEHPHPKSYHDAHEANLHCCAHMLDLPDPDPSGWHER